MKIHAWRLENDNFLKGKYVSFSFLNTLFLLRNLDWHLVLTVSQLDIKFLAFYC